MENLRLLLIALPAASQLQEPMGNPKELWALWELAGILTSQMQIQCDAQELCQNQNSVCRTITPGIKQFQTSEKKQCLPLYTKIKLSVYNWTQLSP